MYFVEQDYFDSYGRCERMGEVVLEAELTLITADNGVELLLCSSCVEDLNIGIVRSEK